MTTIAARLEQTEGHSSGFDYLRIGLSVSVIAWHTVIVCYGAGAETPLLTGPFRPVIYLVLPSFFALSGFLVAGSLFRNNIPAFLGLRALRIFPALFCEVLISALILGPLLTSVTLHEYFPDPKLHAYFLNVIGKIHYQLPGLFLFNPLPNNVNIQLWTIPFELECYIAITVLALLGIVRSPRLFALAFVALSALLLTLAWRSNSAEIVNEGPTGRLCVLSFLAGVLIYVWRERIPFNSGSALVAATLIWAAFYRTGPEYLAALPVAYLTVWLGLHDPKKMFLIEGADYSYGVYLYGFPIQQAVSQLLPQYRFWYVNLIISLIAAGLVAQLSWVFVESKLLKRKGAVIAFMERKLRAWLPAWLTLFLFANVTAPKRSNPIEKLEAV